MSRESSEWLNQNTLVGFTDRRGEAWHYRAADQGVDPASKYPQATPIMASDGTQFASNHYRGAIPEHDVNARLFHWDAVQVKLAADVSMILGVDGPRWKSVSKRVAWLRSDTLDELGFPSPDWTAHPYSEWLIETTQKITDGHELGVASAGLLKGGAQAWVSYEVPDTMHTPEGVQFRPQLLATTSFDGSLATTFKRVVTLVVCDNTLACALGEAKDQQIKVVHSKYSNLKIMDARDALKVIEKDTDAFAREVAGLCQLTVTDKQWSEFLDLYVPLTKDGAPMEKGRSLTMAENKRASLTRLWTSDLRVAPWRGTAWGVVQAGNTWFHHEQVVRGGLRQERNMDNVLNNRTKEHDQGVIGHLNRVLANA